MMKKKVILLICAVCILAALIGVYSVVRSSSTAEEEAKDTLFELTADRIQAISWTSDDGETLSFHRVDGQWSYDDKPELELDQTEMNTLCSGVTGITVYQTLEDVTDLSQYGLDVPQYVLKVTDTEGKMVEVALGDENDAVNSLYVYKDGDDKTVYSVMASLKTAIAKHLSDLEAAEDSSTAG